MGQQWEGVVCVRVYQFKVCGSVGGVLAEVWEGCGYKGMRGVGWEWCAWVRVYLFKVSWLVGERLKP